jgi:hypothetical protein
MNIRLMPWSLAVILGCGVTYAAYKYTPLGPSYPDADRIAQEHRIDQIRENQWCTKHPNHEHCERWREMNLGQDSRK